MANISKDYFENVIDGDTPMWEKTRQAESTKNICLAAIVLMLLDINEALEKIAKEIHAR